jgi:hypothetical protein
LGGINDFSALAGTYVDTKGVGHGFVLNKKLIGSGYNTVKFDVPHSSQNLSVIAISNFGAVLGGYSDSNFVSHGFVRDYWGKITIVDPPGSTGTYPGGINDFGFVSGSYTDANGTPHGFLRHPDGSITSFDAPGSSSGGVCLCAPVSINIKGQIAGTTQDQLGFVRQPDGTFAEFSVGLGNLVTSINAAGETAGYFFIGFNEFRGFIREPNGSISIFDGSGASTGSYQSTQPYTINIFGAVAGTYSGSGFIRTRQ